MVIDSFPLRTLHPEGGSFLARFLTNSQDRCHGMKANVIANYCGQAWRILMQLAFVPVYIRYLGIESYGLIGIFTLLLAWLTLLDVGMRPALFREMARFTAGAHNAQSIRDLLRSVEIVVVAIAAAGTVFGVTRSAGAGHDAARKGRHATTTTTSAAPALSPTTSRPGSGRRGCSATTTSIPRPRRWTCTRRS